MSKLACNIVSYRPDPDLLAASFSERQVEALLCEAGTLLDRCLLDFREYSSLDYAWNRFRTDLDILEREVGLEKKGEPPVKQPEAERSSAWVYHDDPVQTGGEGEAAAEEKQAEAPAAEPQGAGVAAPDLRKEAFLRRKELSESGRPFALDGQRDLVLKRLCRDYEEAVNRVTVAVQGLRKFYGYEDVPAPFSTEAETLAISITNLAIWTRNAIERLVGYQRKEQEFVRAVSVRALLSRSGWGQMRQARDSFACKLQVPAELFQGFENCRLRGIGASLIGEAGSVPWSAVVKLPEAALYLRSGQAVEVDQSDLPPCLLGRLENRRSICTSDICGAVTHINASPIGRPGAEGQWSLEILKPVGVASEVFAQVDDVVLEMKTVGTPQRMGR